MSIHKSQGQTIQRVKVDLGRVFEKGEIDRWVNSNTERFVGQSYVALSRAASLDGLQVLRFDPKKVRPALFGEGCRDLRIHRSWRIQKSSNGTNRFKQPRSSRREWPNILPNLPRSQFGTVYYLICISSTW